jgi:hypothetical protein
VITADVLARVLLYPGGGYLLFLYIRREGVPGSHAALFAMAVVVVAAVIDITAFCIALELGRRRRRRRENGSRSHTGADVVR